MKAELLELASDMDALSWSLNDGPLGDYAERLRQIAERMDDEAEAPAYAQPNSPFGI